MKKLLLAFIVLSGTLPVFAGPGITIFNKEHMNVSVHSRYQYMLDWHGIHNDMLYTYGSIDRCAGGL